MFSSYKAKLEDKPEGVVALLENDSSPEEEAKESSSDEKKSQ